MSFHTQGIWAYGCFATLALPAGVRGVVEFVHPAIRPSALFWNVGKVEVSLEGLPQCCSAWERFPYRTVFVFTVCFFHVPHSFRHFGRDLWKVFWPFHMNEAAWEVPLVGLVHVYCYVDQLLLGKRGRAR